MADDRPLFDDEELPEWLKKAGITYAGKPAAKPESSGTGSLAASPFVEPEQTAPPSFMVSGGTGPLPWANQSSTPQEAAPPSDSFDFPDWMNAPAVPATDDVPPWMQQSAISPAAAPSTSDFDDLPMPSFDDLDWAAEPAAPEAPPVSGTGLTGGLPWRQGASDPADVPQESTDAASDLNWFTPDQAADQTIEPITDTPPEPQAPRGLKNLLNKPSSETAPPPAASEPDLTFEQWAQIEAPSEQAAEHDWLSGVSESAPQTETSDAPMLDFEAMFGESAPPLPAGDTSTPDFADILPDSAPLPDWLTAEPPKQPPSSGTRVLADLIPDSDLPAPADVPDWLQQMTPAAATAEPIESATPANVDDWLRDFTSDAPTVATPAPSQTPAAAPGDVPSWLSDMSIGTPPANSAPAPAADLSDIPDWMRDMAPAEPTPIAETPESVEDWFSDLPPAPMPETKPPAAEPGTLPDWLSAVQPGTTAAPKAASKPPAKDSLEVDLNRPLGSSDIDALMNLPISAPAPSALVKPTVDESPASLDFDLDALLGPMPDAPAAESTSDTSLSRPTFPTARPIPTEPAGPLRKIPQAKPPKAAEPPAGAMATLDLPDFVADLRPTDAPVPLSVGPIRVGVQEAPLAQLTDQMRQLRERAREFKPPEPTQVSSSGPLAEIKDTLAVEPIIVQAASQPATVATVIAGDLQARRVKIIQNLLELEDEQPADIAVTPKVKPRARPKVDRLLITIILLLALVAPFFTDAVNLMGAPGTGSATPAQAAVFAALDSITAGQPVLVAFEYGPTGSGELDDLSRAFLRDLFKKGAKPVIVSTNPSGAMHAEGLLSTFGRSADELAALKRTDKPLLPRADYVVLRYLPAGAAGVRSVINAMYFGGFEAQSSFLTDIEGLPSGLSDADVQRLQGAPALVLAETAEDVRNWAEQFRAPAALSNAAPTKIILAVAAAADATARTYGASQPTTIIGPLIGLRDATVYRALRQPPARPADAKALDQRWQSTGLGALVAGLIIFLGMILNLIRALRRRGSGATQGARR